MPSELLISIVDDDDSARVAVAALVRSFGYTVVKFQSAGDFLRSDYLARTDCLITDVRMPGMSGPQLFRHLISSNMPIPTILITAFAHETARRGDLNAGVKCYLTKPIDPDQLLKCIRSSLKGRNQSSGG